MSTFYKTAAGLVVSALLLSGCFWTPAKNTSSVLSCPLHEKDVPEALRSYYDQTPVWSACYVGLECTRIKVPLNWDNPAGKNIEIAVARQPIRDTTIGYIFYNPGGPGAGVIDIFSGGHIPARPKVAGKYSLVAVDPRGVGESSKVLCYTGRDKDKFLFGASKFPYKSRARAHERDVDFAAFIDACKRGTGDLLGFVDTVQTAKDFDVIRSVLGSPKFNYLGVSYGTYLGGIYATLFPKKVGRMVLDSPFPNDLPSDVITAKQLEGFEKSLHAFIDDCLTWKAVCPFTKTRALAERKLIETTNRLNLKPIPLGDGLVFDGNVFLEGILVPLYSRSSWGILRTALREFFKGNDPKRLFGFVKQYYGRKKDGSYDNSMEAQLAISCLDNRGDMKVHIPTSGEVKKIAPVFSNLYDPSFDSCQKWPVKRTGKVLELNARAADNTILVLAASGDNATPYQWAKRFVSYLGKAHMLTRHGQGHGSYRRGNKCIDSAVDTYFLDGKIPTETDCQPNKQG
ncbi:alpha/beta hydrolase [Tropheryma whipplei]|uniref:alpha/beta hydrolase n=1 Tax=Tropheryma whipplei TaxID=2039 RepID=UPI0004BBB09C|nr:alpha/beta hydrolase [Tropheryma whipplei]